MKTLTIDVVADGTVIGQVEHAESHFADWEALGEQAKQMAREQCPECKRLELSIGAVCLLDVSE